MAQRQIPAAEVVAGDMLVLAEGDIVAADADLVDAAALLVDEPRWPASPFRWTRKQPGRGDGAMSYRLARWWCARAAGRW